MKKMSKKVAWAITDQNVTVCYDGETHIVKRTDKLGEQLITALKAKDMDSIPDLVSAAKRIESFSKGNFVVKDGEIYVNGIVAPTVLGNKIVRFSEEGLPFEPLVKFAESLQKNPSFRAVNELFQFLEKNDHPITENGSFIAYKKVRADFMDVHSGTFDNSVGNVVEMPRNQVNEDATQTCSNGLHVANYNYATNFYGGGVMLEVEVNPADVVSVPVDYNNAKIRVCKYKVLGVVTQEHDANLQYKNVSNPNWDDADELDEEENEEDDDGCEECGGYVEYGFDLCEDCETEFYDNELR
jgi:hypothetical protein